MDVTSGPTLCNGWAEHRDISRTGQIWGSLNLKSRIGWLKNAIQETEAHFKRDPASIEYLARLNLVADRVRATWERVVEEGMFSESIVRYRKGVETKRIESTGISSSPNVVARVFWGMSDMSDITEAHDTTAEIGGAPPFGPDEMRRWLVDLESVIALIDEEKKQSKQAIQAAIKAPRG